MKNQLYKTAIISSPIMAIFEITPIFIIAKQPLHQFWLGFVFVTILTFIIWTINIGIINIGNYAVKAKYRERYILSYTFTLLFFSIIWITSEIFHINNRSDRPSIIFPIINILSTNTIILIITSTIISHFKRNQLDMELSELKIKHLEAEQQQLVQQLQPHFLFNALSTLKSLINSNTDLAEEYLLKLSDFLRFTVSAHENAIISLKDELTFTKNYIELQQIRFSDSFFCTISIPDESLTQYSIPVYALQSLVENALKHNAFTEQTPLQMSIHLLNERLIVTNNKLSKPLVNNSSGIGLKNLNKRYNLIVNEQISITENNETFTVELKLIKT